MYYWEYWHSLMEWEKATAFCAAHGLTREQYAVWANDPDREEPGNDAIARAKRS